MRQLVAATLTLVGLVACGGGGGGKGADSPGTCPEGTVLKGEDCVPAGDEGSSSKSSSKSSDPDEKPSGGGSSENGASGGGAGGGGGGGEGAGGATPYDKDAVEVQLKRAARQVKANCGSASDENGKATGPWGSLKASVTLGRNGHVRGVTIPSPYDGKPVGICAVHAFERIQFPPYAGSSDVVLDWDIEIVQPKH